MKNQEGRVKVWKSHYRADYVWSCLMNRCQAGPGDKYGHGPIWQLVVHEADAHARLHHHKPVPRDEDRTPPNGIHRVVMEKYEIATDARGNETWRTRMSPEHSEWRARVFGE